LRILLKNDWLYGWGIATLLTFLWRFWRLLGGGNARGVWLLLGRGDMGWLLGLGRDGGRGVAREEGRLDRRLLILSILKEDGSEKLRGDDVGEDEGWLLELEREGVEREEDE
jgi:hypothetical protein